MQNYTIGELALAVGIPTSTIRYYERRNLIAPTGRSESNYRIYSAESRTLLRFIRAAQTAGFQLKDIELLIELRSGKGNPCGEVRTVIEERLGELDAKLAELQHARMVLEQTLQWCRGSETTGRCGALEKLSRDSSQ